MGTRIDDDVLRDMSVALSQGRRVRFTPEGDPTASLGARGSGMQQAAADFLGTKVDEINALLDKGLEVNVDPDGSIFAFTPDRSSRYISDANPDIELLERMTVHDGIRKGANVVIEPDGSIGYHIAPGTTPPTDEQAAARIAAFDEQLDSGKFGEAVKAGKQFELSNAGSMSYVADDSSGISGVAGGTAVAGPIDPAANTDASTTDAATTDPTASGDDSAPPDERALDPAAMRAESAAATQLAARIREVAYDHFTEDYSTLSIARDDEARRVWALRQEASSADMQIKREQRNVDMYQQELAGADAAKGTAYAMDPGVYDHTRAMAAIARARLDAATQHAADLRSQADAAEQQVAAHEQGLEDLGQQFDDLQTDAATMEARAQLLDLNAQLVADIDDLETRAAALRERGDEAGAAELDAAAASRRSDLEADTKQLDDYRIDDERLEPLGIDVDDEWADADDVLGTTPATPATDVMAPGTRVIDMEPEIIEGTPPTVIDMEPEVIEVPAPAAEVDDFQEDLTQIAQVEQQLDQLDEFEG